MTDFDVIRKMTAGNVVAMPTSLTYMRYALTGTVLLFEPGRLADFVISRSRHESAALLTPDNRRVFLYRHDEYERHIEHMLDTTPLIHAHYRQHIVDVYLYDGHLYYVRRHPRSVVALLDWHVPVVGEPVQATLSSPLRATRPWQWERGSDRDGWTTVRATISDGSHRYVPTAADLGSRLRAHVEYLDSGGQWVKARTDSLPPSGGAGHGTASAAQTAPGTRQIFSARHPRGRERPAQSPQAVEVRQPGLLFQRIPAIQGASHCRARTARLRHRRHPHRPIYEGS